MIDDYCVFAHLRTSGAGKSEPLNKGRMVFCTTRCGGHGVSAHLRVLCSEANNQLPTND